MAESLKKLSVGLWLLILRRLC